MQPIHGMISTVFVLYMLNNFVVRMFEMLYVHRPCAESALLAAALAHAHSPPLPSPLPPLKVSDYSDFEDDLEAAASGAGKKNIREKFRQLQEVLLIVQNVLGDVADNGERVNK